MSPRDHGGDILECALVCGSGQMIPGLLSRQLVVVLASRYDACEEDQLVYCERGVGATVKVGLRRTQNPKKPSGRLRNGPALYVTAHAGDSIGNEDWRLLPCVGNSSSRVNMQSLNISGRLPVE
jgi:hypothetical protein